MNRERHSRLRAPFCITSQRFKTCDWNFLNGFCFRPNYSQKGHEAFDYSRLKRGIKRNQNFCFQVLKIDRQQISRPIFDPNRYTFDGAYWVPNVEFQKYAPEFLKKSRRSVAVGDRVYLRGTRYTISSNPTFEVRQKLDGLIEDFVNGIEAIQTETDLEYVLAIADYIKNASITLLNSLIVNEKVGKFGFSNVAYQTLRKDAQSTAQAACDLFYGIMLGNEAVYKSAFVLLSKNGESVLKRIEDRILHDYKEGSFSSRHITRPEASHPLTIGGFAFRLAIEKRSMPDTILGMPSGATELALATGAAFRHLRNRSLSVVLFPASLHSVKHDFDNAVGEPAYVDQLVEHNKSKFRNKSVLIVDDNSSTGRTLEVVTSRVRSTKPRILKAFVAEADIVRTQIRQREGAIASIAAPLAYSMSMNVLPVSRRVAPKVDLKQLNEKRRMITCVKQRYLRSNGGDPIRSIMGNLYVDLIGQPNMSGSGVNEIVKFRKTFLSNFSRVDVLLGGVGYNSVEHAYQKAKLSSNSLDSLEDEHIKIINKKLASRGAKIDKKSVLSFFSNPDMDAGTSKIVGNQLRILGFVREDWDHVKLPIMIYLLLQKFSNREAYEQLQSTESKTLIEGNDWGDTYWGGV